MPLNAGPSTGDEPTTVASGTLVVLVHGCMDYRKALGFSLAPSASTAQVVAEAFSRRGPDSATRLAGDFATVVWDNDANLLWAYRTFPGPYPIYYARLGGAHSGVVLSSSIGGVLTHPEVEDTVNRVAVAEAAGGLLFGEHGETCRQAVRVHDPGWALV